MGKRKVLYRLVVEVRNSDGGTKEEEVPPSNLVTQMIEEECYKRRDFRR